MPETKHIMLTEIDPPDTPLRFSMDDQQLTDLKESMGDVGLIHPLAVVERDGRYVIEDGHRRYLCASALGWPTIRCEVYTPEEIASGAVMVAANRFREETSAAEEALCFQEHRERFNLDEAGLCARFHVTPDYLGDRLRLLRGDKKIFDSLLARRINFSVARELNKCPDEAHRRYLLDIAERTGYSAHVMAGHVADWKKHQQPALPQPPTAPDAPPPDAPAPYVQECCFCGGSRDPWNLVPVMIHKRELEEIRALLAKAANE